MRAVLGIDAAWTVKEPSGVAVAVEKHDGWHLRAAESSYERFYAKAENKSLDEGRPHGSSPNAARLLDAAKTLCCCPVDLAAVDMPLSRSPIVKRRYCDDAVSRAYGKYKCGTHSPNATRPGSVSEEITSGFEKLDYVLCTDKITCPGLVEVYPHPALVQLTNAEERLRYKSAKVSIYWKSDERSKRREKLYLEWNKIVAALEREITGVKTRLPLPAQDAKTWELKAYEDTLDAVVCAWVAVCCLNGKSTYCGDRDSAIWIPNMRPISSPHISSITCA